MRIRKVFTCDAPVIKLTTLILVLINALPGSRTSLTISRVLATNLEALELDKVMRLDGSKRFGWWAARKRSEVPDHVHLIVIICGMRDFEP